MYKASIFTILLVFASLGWAQEPGVPPETQAPQGEMGRMGGRRSPGTMGTITAISADSITLKTQDGKTEQVNLTPNTQFRKERQPAQASDFKVGDEVFVRGQAAGTDALTADVVAARPAGGGEFERRMRQDLGKKFIAGEVTAVNGTQLTISRPDGVSQTITADESTSFRKQNESITLADIKVGDHVFGRGELKNDVFVPAVLNVGQPGMMRRGPGQAPQGAPGQGGPQS